MRSGMCRLRQQAAWVVLAIALALPAPASDFAERLVTHTLDNGLTILIYPRRQAPVFSSIIMVRAGSVDETMGSTGIAHMLEHMAFKGTRHIGTKDFAEELPLLEEIWATGRELTGLTTRRDTDERPDPARDARIKELTATLDELHEKHREVVQKDEIDAIYTRHGGTGLNASTSNDFTTYYIDLPSNKLELWAMIESQRFAEPILREFYTERDVVAEERRMRTDSNPFGKTFEVFLANVFIAHPYHHPIIGWMSDIQAYTKEKAEAFFRANYGPDNMVISLVGDIDPDTAIPLIERYFGGLKPSGKERQVVTIEPEQSGERRMIVEVEMMTNPAVGIAYRKETLPARQDLLAQVLNEVLAGGESARLQRRLVKEEEIAVGVGSFIGPGERYDNAMLFFALPRAPHTTRDCEKAIYDELDRIGKDLVSEEELKTAVFNIKARFVRSFRSNQGLAITLAESHLLTGDPLFGERRAAELDSVTREELRDVAKEIFGEGRRTVATLRQKKGSGLLGGLFGGGGK